MKLAARIAVGVLAVVAVAAVGFGALYASRIQTANSIEKLTDYDDYNLYRMQVRYDYDLDKMIANTTDPDELEKLNAYKESLETEKSLRVTVMTEAFGKGLTMVDTTQKKLNVAVADLGTRYDRLKLTSDKLADQKVDVEEQLSNNEDVDISDAYINLTQADNLYQYALTATSKILGNTLLDYI